MIWEGDLPLHQGVNRIDSDVKPSKVNVSDMLMHHFLNDMTPLRKAPTCSNQQNLLSSNYFDPFFCPTSAVELLFFLDAEETTKYSQTFDLLAALREQASHSAWGNWVQHDPSGF